MPYHYDFGEFVIAFAYCAYWIKPDGSYTASYLQRYARVNDRACPDQGDETLPVEDVTIVSNLPPDDIEIIRRQRQLSIIDLQLPMLGYMALGVTFSAN